MSIGPRLFGIPATEAPIVAVIRRGPSAWSHVGLWDVDAGRFESGSWLRGHIYPQRCDISPDGRWLSYFTLASSADWAAGATYIAISRLPWLHALAAWGTGGTWTQGARFTADRSSWPAEPDHGEVSALRRRYGLAFNGAASYAVERRRGWTETDDSPSRDADDAWDVRRALSLRMQKPQPGTPDRKLAVRGNFAAFRAGPASFADAAYSIEYAAGATPLLDVQWADWSADGRLLVATTGGQLQIRQCSGTTTTTSWEHDLSGSPPEPTPPPAAAREW